MVHDADEPGFDNREARDTLSESLDDPIDVDPKEGLEGESAPTKKSSMPFYGAVGAFAVVALGLLGYKLGLIGGPARKPIEPTVASAMAETPQKTDSLMGAAGASTGASPDLLRGDAKPRSDFDAEADLLSGKGPASASAPTASVGPVVAVSEPAKASPLVEPVVQVAAAPAPALAPVPAAPAVVEKQAPGASRVEDAKAKAEAVAAAAAAAAAAPARPPRTEPSEAAAVAAKAAPSKAARPTQTAAARKAVPATKVAAPRSVAARPVRIAEVRKPSKGKRVSQVDKDPTPESTEVLAGWKLRGTWPTHGPSQLAWIADENGRLATVSVGTRVSGARVVSIGKRGELVQTTAGQILP
ncbi:hypothetical protein LJR175_008430 [Variovorax sp. LjRoot175]|uniref:hypothetical protein n=1 Tax=Variovorax sp. LjRoot175 TaxID=3342276 RepID=UPI003ECCF5FA